MSTVLSNVINRYETFIQLLNVFIDIFKPKYNSKYNSFNRREFFKSSIIRKQDFQKVKRNAKNRNGFSKGFP